MRWIGTANQEKGGAMTGALKAMVAREHVQDLLREAEEQRLARTPSRTGLLDHVAAPLRRLLRRAPDGCLDDA